MRRALLVIMLAIMSSLPACIPAEQSKPSVPPATPTPPVSPTVIPPLKTTPKPPPLSNSISGHVYRSDGKTPVAGARIEFSDNVGMSWTMAGSSDVDGRYVITGLTSGEYILEVEARGYFPEFYDGIHADNRSVQHATKIQVKDNMATTHIDFTLDAIASISGHVYRADNKTPIAGATVLVYGPGWWGPNPPSATTAEDGSYTIDLDRGESYVIARAKGYVPQLYDGTYS